MLNTIDNFLNKITMYRLILYYLIFLIFIAGILGHFGLLPYGPLALFFSTSVLILLSWMVNSLFAYILKVQTNSESVYITALILVLIITPPQTGSFITALPFLFWAAVWSQAGKYIFNIDKKHLFNPAALAVVITSFAMNQSATWWIGTPAMFFFVLLGGLLIIRKVRRFDAVIAFVAAAIVSILALSWNSGNPLSTIYKSILYSPLIFLAAVMLTEPLTMPPTRDGRIAYGILVGWLFAPQTHFGSFYFTPELALLAGNIFTYVISPKGRHVLKLKKIVVAGEGIYDFVFESNRQFNFAPGQYMEWTLGHNRADSRGNRRYFTIASSPTEREIILGVKFYDKPSSYKKALLAMKPGDEIVAGQLAGDFTLPNNPKEKLVFIAGGIGVTPFRSMLKYLTDKNEQRSVTLFYSNRTDKEIVYQNILSDAWKKFGLKIICNITGTPPKDWQGYTGYITPELVAKEVPDYKERIFYISGSHTMVTTFKKTLTQIGVPRAKIKTDFFPGLA